MTFRNEPIKAGSLKKDQMAPYRRDIDRKIIEAIARQVPLQREPLIDYLRQGNAATVARVVEYCKQNGSFRQPELSKGNGNGKGGKFNFEIGVKQCVDARQVTLDLDMLLKYLIIHERTAGNVIRRGKFLEHIIPTGVAIVEGHKSCGGLKAAHDTLDKPLDDADLRMLVESVPMLVRQIGDAEVRDRQNAVVQALTASKTLSRTVYSSFFTWDSSFGYNYEWLDGQPISIDITKAFANAAVRMTRYASAEGRVLDSHYAVASLVYDPYRLGRISSPWGIFGELPCGIFGITTNLRPFDPANKNGEAPHISRTAMASLKYANFDGGGHVRGVGGEDGTHMVGILDTSAEVVQAVKEYLLSFPAIRELTKGGENIIGMTYTKDTAEVRFLK